MIRIIILLVFFISAISVQSQISPELSLDTTFIKTGERTYLNIEVEYRVDDGGHTIQWPQIADTLANGIEVISKSKIDTITDPLKNDQFLFSQVQRIEITSFDTGFVAIQPLLFIIDGDSVSSNAILIEVRDPVIDESADIRDIHDIIEVELSLWEKLLPYWPYILGALAALIIIILIIRKLKGKTISVKTEKEIEIPVVPAHIKALSGFAALREEELWQKGKHKQYYTRLSDIMREYLHERYGIQAMEETSTELIRQIQRMPLDSGIRLRLETVLRLSDLVKFAKEKPMPHENEDSMQVMVNFVQQTAETFSSENIEKNKRNA